MRNELWYVSPSSFKRCSTSRSASWTASRLLGHRIACGRGHRECYEVPSPCPRALAVLGAAQTRALFLCRRTRARGSHELLAPVSLRSQGPRHAVQVLPAEFVCVDVLERLIVDLLKLRLESKDSIGMKGDSSSRRRDCRRAHILEGRSECF